MKPLSIIIFLLIVAGFVFPSNGQRKSNKHITGYVTDSRYYPVVGVFIMFDGKTSDIVTDEKGFYKVRITPNAETIGVYSNVYGVVEEVINGRTRINFTFSRSFPEKNIIRSNTEIPEDEDEINVGYGTKKRRELTTSVYKLDANERRFSTSNSIFDMLKGSVPGVQVYGNQVRIRGSSSMFASNDPLYIVDDTPVTSIEDIKPQTVESISVLEGPAAAIYGSRGANGVILIDLVDAPDVKGVVPVAGIKIPFADTQSATNIQSKAATLNAAVNPNDLSAFVTFEYGTDTGYGNKKDAAQNPVSGGSLSNVSAVVTDLLPGVTYHYRVVANNSFGSKTGNDISFTTPGGIPMAETSSVLNTTPVTAQLNGVVNPNFLSTDVSFEYGTDTSYLRLIVASESPLTGNSPVRVSANVTGLEPGTTYHYRIVAANENGTTFGADKTFKAEYVLGEYINGGYIFYIDETGKHGLVCAPSDQSQTAIWGDCVPSGAAGRIVKAGNQNTADIVRDCPDAGTAARLCYDLELNGYNDWYLPSLNELHLMYTNLHENGVGGFKETYYWSSTQDKHGAWVVSFYYGSKSNQSRNKNAVLTRAVRGF